MFALGTMVISTYDTKLRGRIIGYGSLQWNADPLTPVYLICIEPRGSSALGPAVRVARDEHLVEWKKAKKA